MQHHAQSVSQKCAVSLPLSSCSLPPHRVSTLIFSHDAAQQNIISLVIAGVECFDCARFCLSLSLLRLLHQQLRPHAAATRASSLSALLHAAPRSVHVHWLVAQHLQGAPQARRPHQHAVHAPTHVRAVAVRRARGSWLIACCCAEVRPVGVLREDGVFVRVLQRIVGEVEVAEKHSMLAGGQLAKASLQLLRTDVWRVERLKVRCGLVGVFYMFV
jgi:hypothetical protein